MAKPRLITSCCSILFQLIVSEDTRKRVFEEEAGQTLLEDGIIRLFSFDTVKEEIIILETV